MRSIQLLTKQELMELSAEDVASYESFLRNAAEAAQDESYVRICMRDQDRGETCPEFVTDRYKRCWAEALGRER